MCSFIRVHTHCNIDDCCFRWDDSSLYDRLEIFGYTQQLKDVNEYDPNSSIVVVYIFHNAAINLAQFAIDMKGLFRETN